MISYAPFYETLKEKNVSTYKLIHQYGVSRSLLDRLRHDKPISTVTLNDLCKILSCKVEDIIVFVPDEIVLHNNIVFFVFYNTKSKLKIKLICIYQKEL